MASLEDIHSEKTQVGEHKAQTERLNQGNEGWQLPKHRTLWLLNNQPDGRSPAQNEADQDSTILGNEGRHSHSLVVYVPIRLLSLGSTVDPHAYKA